MSTRPAKMLTMTAADGSNVVCPPATRVVAQDRPRRAMARRSPSAEIDDRVASTEFAQFYRKADIRYSNACVEELSQRDRAFEGTYLRDSQVVAGALRKLYGDLTYEVIGVVALGPRLNPYGHCILGQGTSTYTTVSKSDMARFLALSCAASCILFHNHPSGSSEWSGDDFNVTEEVSRLCTLMGVHLADHVLITKTSHRSMLDSNPERLKVK